MKNSEVGYRNNNDPDMDLQGGIRSRLASVSSDISKHANKFNEGQF